jgi:hypothetical protein
MLLDHGMATRSGSASGPQPASSLACAAQRFSATPIPSVSPSPPLPTLPLASASTVSASWVDHPPGPTHQVHAALLCCSTRSSASPPSSARGHFLCALLGSCCRSRVDPRSTRGGRPGEEPPRSSGAEHSGDASPEAAPGVRGGGATACAYCPALYVHAPRTVNLSCSTPWDPVGRLPGGPPPRVHKSADSIQQGSARRFAASCSRRAPQPRARARAPALGVRGPAR